MVKKAPIFVALDTTSLDDAVNIANDVKDFVIVYQFAIIQYILQVDMKKKITSL